MLERVTLGDGEVAIVNDPYAGGTHLPDVTLVRPVFAGRRARSASSPTAPITPTSAAARPARCRSACARAATRCPRRDELPAAMAPRYATGAEPVAGRRAPVTIDDEGLRLAPQLLDERGGAAVRASRARRRSGAAIWRRSGRRSRSAAGGCAALADDLRRRRAGGARARRSSTTPRRCCARPSPRIPDGVYAFADSLDDDGAGRNDVGIRVHAAPSPATARSSTSPTATRRSTGRSTPSTR